ncbi:MAG: hypothetical protein NUV84_04620 [Candidatus Uhrbacteria bacterium]|nr:hypothetical protein [Candidatus Uhrbacteria bacterium]
MMLLIILQVSFIHALPFPFDRIPLVLVVTIYLYQYSNQTSIWWWLISYGLILDVLDISVAPLEVISYGLTAFTMTLLVAHVFTNRSFYGMAATALLSLLVMLLSELSLIGAAQLFASVHFSWQDVVFSNVWAMAFACFSLLFIFPSLHRVRFFLQKLFLERL